MFLVSLVIYQFDKLFSLCILFIYTTTKDVAFPCIETLCTTDHNSAYNVLFFSLVFLSFSVCVLGLGSG